VTCGKSLEDYVGERPLGKGWFTYMISRDVDNAAGTAGAGQKPLPTPN